MVQPELKSKYIRALIGKAVGDASGNYIKTPAKQVQAAKIEISRKLS